MARRLPLSLPEKDDLADLERVVDRGLSTFTEVGLALCSIRDRRLYRDTHDTFEGYCRERWTMTRQYANRLIVAHQVAAGLETIVSNPDTLPASEAQARALAGLDVEEAAEVMDEVTGGGTRPTTAAEINVAAMARKAGIDPARLTAPPADGQAKALARMRASVRGIEREVGKLDARHREDILRWLAKRPACLVPEG